MSVRAGDFDDNFFHLLDSYTGGHGSSVVHELVTMVFIYKHYTHTAKCVVSAHKVQLVFRLSGVSKYKDSAIHANHGI